MARGRVADLGGPDRQDLVQMTGDLGRVREEQGGTAEQVGAFVVDGPDPLIDYHVAVHEMTLSVLASLTPADYERIVDERWDPPVTAAVRLVEGMGMTTSMS